MTSGGLTPFVSGSTYDNPTLTAAKIAKRSMMGNPLLRQALMICDETIAVDEPKVLTKPIATILICEGYN